MKRFRWLLPLILLVAIGAVVWGNFYRSRTTGGLAVRAAPVKPGDVIALVNAPGVVAALQEVTVRAKIGAAVAAVLVKEGDRVTEGQALIRLEDRDLQTAVAQAEQAVAQSESVLAALERRAALAPQQSQQALAAAELSLRQAEAGLTLQQQSTRDRLQKARLDLTSLRQKESTGMPADQFSRDLQAAMLSLQAAEKDLQNLEPDATTPSAAVFTVQSARISLERAQIDAQNTQVLPEERAAALAALARARQALEVARQRLQDATVKAPFTGSVLAMTLKVGDLLSPGGPVLLLGAVDTVLAKIRVDEVDVGSVVAGQSVSVSATAYSGVTFTGKVRDVAPSATVGGAGQAGAAATFEVRAEVGNAEGKLRPGMNIDTEITTREARGVLMLGVESVSEREGKRFVFVVEGDAVKEREVTTGVRSRTQLEITGGLKAGEMVVTGPYDALKKLKDGAPVQVEAAPAAAKP